MLKTWTRESGSVDQFAYWLVLKEQFLILIMPGPSLIFMSLFWRNDDFLCYPNIGLIGFVICIFDLCFMFFLPFGKQNQTDVWPRFQSFLKLLLWNKVVEWVKVFNAMGLLFYHYYLIFFPATPASFPQRVLKCARCASEIDFHVLNTKEKVGF